MSKRTGRISISREDGDAVPVFVIVDELHGGVEVSCAYETEDGSEDLFLIDPRLRSHVVEQTCTQEESVPAWERSGPAIGEEFSSLGGADVDVASDLAEMDAGDQGSHIGVRLRARGR